MDKPAVNVFSPDVCVRLEVELFAGGIGTAAVEDPKKK
jgi:hypothetical protein